jgi:hypothetical protein
LHTQAVVSLVTLCAIAGWGARHGLGRWQVRRTLHDERQVSRPDPTGSSAVRAGRASAVTGAGEGLLTVESCSRWIEPGALCEGHADEVVDSDRALTTLVKKWARGRHCVMCGAALTDSAVAAHRVVLLDPGGGTRKWASIRPDTLALALATCLPACWNCHIAETFRRLRPDLVTERDDRVVHVVKPR